MKKAKLLPVLKSPYCEIITSAFCLLFAVFFVVFPQYLSRYSWICIFPVIGISYSFGAGVGLASALFWLLFPAFLREVFGYPDLFYSIDVIWAFRGILIGLSLLVGYMSSLVRQVQSNLEEIEQLRSIIPVCARCKKVRDDDGFWQEVDIYLREHSLADVTHGLCTECAQTLYPEEFSNIEREYFKPFRKAKESKNQ